MNCGDQFGQKKNVTVNYNSYMTADKFEMGARQEPTLD